MRRELGMFVALVVMCVGIYVSNDRFLGQSNIWDIGRYTSMLGIFAIGISFVIITGGIDLSIGSVIGLTGVIIAKFCSEQQGGWGLSLWIGIPAALAIALLIGYLQGWLITRLDLQPFIVTLAGMLMIRGISQKIVQGGTISMGTSSLRQLVNEGLFKVGDVYLISYPMLMFLGVVAIATFVLHYSVFGRYVYAIGGSRDAAKYSGIPVKRVELATYMICSFLGGVAGICYASYVGEMDQKVGQAYELKAIAAAVLGGCSLRGGEGSILGVIIGSAVTYVIENGIIMFQWHWAGKLEKIDKNYTEFIIGSVILLAVVLDQVVHIVQAKRRTRMAAIAASSAVPPQMGFDVLPAAGGDDGPKST